MLCLLHNIQCALFIAQCLMFYEQCLLRIAHYAMFIIRLRAIPWLLKFFLLPEAFQG